MASIEYRKKTIRIMAYVGKQKQCFPLGRVTKKTAERFANNIDTLLHERRYNLPISREVLNWLVDLDDSIHGMLAEQGLVDPRTKAGSILSTASGSRWRCNPDGLCERGHFKGAAEAVAEIGEGAYAQLLRCLHQRCEDVHRTDASLATAV